ncbi:protein-disulfide reductase DsbD domain-containing protein, partial [Brevundimonas sp.]|uniref:protein-disulfide reductase DsbD domain-containing protein n=1 Tax=Brevundimonas sp. TaxID=1871086 RepID=UPI0025BF7F6A
LVPLSSWAAPGSTVVVAVRQKIAPGWHTYWRNPGDSGGPTTLDWTLPQGVKAGGITWPLPERQRLLSLINYGYSGEVYLPVTIEVPASARPGTTLPLIADALFLVCSDQMCVPVPMQLRLDRCAKARRRWMRNMVRRFRPCWRPRPVPQGLMRPFPCRTAS